MTNNTELDATKLFADITKAMQEDDSNKLSELIAEESPEIKEQVEDETHTTEEESEEEVSTDTENEDVSEEDTSDETETKADDPLEALRKEIAELKKAQQSLGSQAGRVPSIQRRLAEYDKKLAELKDATSSQASKKVKPEIDEALKELDDSDPALAATLRKVMEKALAGVDEEATTKEVDRLQSLRDLEYDEYVEEQKSILFTKYPNAGEVFKSPHWQSWKKEVPEHIRSLATSDSAEAVIMALDIYRQDMLKKFPDLGKTETTVEDKTEVVNEQAKQIEEERNNKKKTAVNITGGKAPLSGKVPTDAESLFKKFSEEIRKDITGT